MIIKNLQADFGAVPGTDVLAACQDASHDIWNHPYSAYKLIIPSGHYYLSDTWEISGNLGRTIVIEGEVGSGLSGTTFRPHSTFDPTVILSEEYVSLVRVSGLANNHFTAANNANPQNIDPNFDLATHQHRDYRSLIRLRGLNESSAFRGITIWGRDEVGPGVARLGKGLWIDFFLNTVNNVPTYIPSNGLLVEECSISAAHAVLEQPNPALDPLHYPWLPAVSVQVGSCSTDKATRQVSNVRVRRVIVNGGQGPDPFPMRTDLGFWFGEGNMKNYTIADCNILSCRYGIRTSGSGYTNITSCDFASSGDGTPQPLWPDGADLLVPQAHVNVIGCGSEGSSRFIQGDGAPGGFGSLNIDSCYWSSNILPKDVADTGFIIRNANQSVYIRGLWASTYGGGPGAARTAIQVNFNKYRPAGLELVNSHLEGVSQPLGDALIYDGSNNLLLPQLEELAYVANSEDVRLFLQNNTSWEWLVNPYPIPLQNYDHSGVKRIGGQAVKVTTAGAPGLTLEPWHHTVVADATAGDVVLTLPKAQDRQGREYVIKRYDRNQNTVTIKVAENSGDRIDSGPTRQLAHLEFCRLVSNGKKVWMVLG